MNKIKTLLVLILVLTLAPFFNGPVNAADETMESIILATTYSVSDTGLLDELLADFKAKEKISVKPIIAGSGESLKMGERGECDVIIAHSREAEEKFMESGFGKDRKSLAKNEFYLIGPENDPAKAAASKDIYEAFTAIDKNATFISRGDKSGTHTREMAIWKKAGIEKKAGEKYIVCGQGMAETLRIADEKAAYTLCDSATYTVLKTKLKIKNIFADPKNLTNIYSIITINPEKSAKIKYSGAKKFYDFMFSKETIEKISAFGVKKYASPLFTVLDENKK